MTDEQLFLRAICADPADDLPRLVYADWLDDHGRPDRAEFIRVQSELATQLPAPFESCDEWAVNMRKGERCGRCKWCYFMNCTSRMLDNHVVSWTGNWVGERVPAFKSYGEVLFRRKKTAPELPDIEATFRRGFVAEVRCTLAAFVGRVCENCEGTGELVDPRGPCGECGGATEPREDHTDRGWYPGTGRTPGIAAELFKSHPVERVVLTDREPFQTSSDVWLWMSLWMIHTIPTELFNLVYPVWPPPQRDHRVHWQTRELALAALSAACVAWGRSLAGLSSLKEMT